MICLLLLVLTAELLYPIDFRAESYKLLVRVREMRAVSSSVLTMASKEACEEGKKKVVDVSNWEGESIITEVAAICIKSE